MKKRVLEIMQTVRRWKSLILVVAVFGCGQLPQCGGAGGIPGCGGAGCGQGGCGGGAGVPGCQSCGGAGGCSGCGSQGCLFPSNVLQAPPPVELDVNPPQLLCNHVPTSIHCCMPDDPVSLQNEEKCCEGYKTIEQARLAAGMTLDQSARTGMTDAESAAWREACCDIGENRPCCLAVLTGGDLSVCATAVPGVPGGPGGDTATTGGPGQRAVSLDCGCAEEDRVPEIDKEDLHACYYITREGGRAPASCQMVYGTTDVGGTQVPLTKEQVLEGVQTIEWTQVSGTLIGVVAGSGVTASGVGGWPVRGMTTIATSVKALVTEPINDRIDFLLAPPQMEPGKNCDLVQLLATGKDVNGIIRTVSAPGYFQVCGGSKGGGGCSLTPAPRGSSGRRRGGRRACAR